MLPIRRNIALLSGAGTANRAMLQLIAAVAAISLARVLEADGLLGLGPAIVLAAGGVAVLATGAVALVTLLALWILRGQRCHASQLDARRRCTWTCGRLDLEATR